MRDHDARRAGEEAADEVETVGAAVQREGRLVFGNGQTAKVIGGDVRKISKEEMVISNWRQLPPERSGAGLEIGEQVALDESDAVGNGVALGVEACKGEGIGGDVQSGDAGGREAHGEGHGDTAGAGANVEDVQGHRVLPHPRPLPAPLRFGGCSAISRWERGVQRHFDQQFGFRARDEDAGVHQEVEVAKLAVAGEVGQWLACGHARDQRLIVGEQVGRDDVFGPGEQLSARDAEDVRQQGFGGEAGRVRASVREGEGRAAQNFKG
jgi:hypothetical protein